MDIIKRANLNSAAAEIAKAVNGRLGIRRTYGGGDNSNRMHITWQILGERDRVIGMIDLVCEDGFGQDGMRWGAFMRVTAPGVSFEDNLMSPWGGYVGRKAKRFARRRFFEKVDSTITKIGTMRSKPVVEQIRMTKKPLVFEL